MPHSERPPAVHLHPGAQDAVDRLQVNGLACDVNRTPGISCRAFPELEQRNQRSRSRAQIQVPEGHVSCWDSSTFEAQYFLNFMSKWQMAEEGVEAIAVIIKA